MAHNPISDPTWFELACGTPYEGGKTYFEEINAVQISRNRKWKLIGAAMRAALHLGISRSALVMDLAHDDGSTPLACAARAGNVKVVRWLLNNGALRSMHLKTKNGRSAMDLSRIFGPHKEVPIIVVICSRRAFTTPMCLRLYKLPGRG